MSITTPTPMTRASPRSSSASTATAPPARSSSPGWSNTPSSPPSPATTRRSSYKNPLFAGISILGARGPPCPDPVGTASLQLKEENHGQEKSRRGEHLQEEEGRIVGGPVPRGYPRWEDQEELHL